MSANALMQDDLSRQRRLNNARCPTHNWFFDIISITPNGRKVVRCVYPDCKFTYVIKPGSKIDHSMKVRTAHAKK